MSFLRQFSFSGYSRPIISDHLKAIKRYNLCRKVRKIDMRITNFNLEKKLYIRERIQGNPKKSDMTRMSLFAYLFFKATMRRYLDVLVPKVAWLGLGSILGVLLSQSVRST